MSLSNEQRSRLAATARERGLDPAKLIAAAERLSEEQPPTEGDEQADSTRQKSAKRDSSGSAEQPKLFMYLLPFVTVREVREKWLGLTDSFAGDGEVASKWAAKQGGDAAPDSTDVPE